jgi:hypothetical protein
MKNNFTKNCLEIFLNKKQVGETEEIILNISSDYSRSNRKSKLYVNEKTLATQLEEFWKSITTKKLIKLEIGFGEIDYYDDMTDIYETPIIYIKRGLRKAKIEHRDHGSIPKDWSFDISAIFSPVKTSPPIFEIIKKALGSYFTEEHEKALLKKIKPFLQGKEKHLNFEI